MIHIRPEGRSLPMRAALLVALTVAFAASPALARQVLFVANLSNNTVGEYNASTGAAINTAFINGQGLNGPLALALDGNNHLFVSNYYGNTVGEYDATTGATVNATFINGPGLDRPLALALDRSNHIFVNNTTNSVGRYNATSGAVINTAFVSGLYISGGLALDGNNHLFVTNSQILTIGTVGEYDANTGAPLTPHLSTGYPLQRVWRQTPITTSSRSARIPSVQWANLTPPPALLSIRCSSMASKTRRGWR